MKTLISALAISLLFTFTAQANEAMDLGTVVCHQILPTGSKKSPATAILTQVAKFRYNLAVFTKDAYGQRVPVVNAMTAVYGQDVMMIFNSPGRKITFGIYLDELDQSYLKSESLGLDMRFNCTFGNNR